jgi:dipeptidyl aminopeptidase/acylaminoacyl peptidase
MAEQTRRKLTPEDLYKLINVSDPQISPDGEVIAFVRTHIDQESKEPRSSIWLVPATGGTPVQFTRGNKSDSAPRWSPDGQTLAFVSDRGGDLQIWLIGRHGGEAQQLTFMRNGAGAPTWSPDGKRIAFGSAVMHEDKREHLTSVKTEADKKGVEQKAKDVARVFTRMGWRSDAIGIKPEGNNHIWIVDVPEAGQPVGAPVQVTWGNYDHGGPHWSPCGTKLSFTAKRSDDEHGRFVDVFVTALPGAESPACKATPTPLAPGATKPEGDEAKSLADACGCAAKEATEAFQPVNITGSKGFLAGGIWSPDGSTLAVVGHENEFQNATQAKIYLFPAEGGEPRILDNWDLAIGDSVNADVRLGGDGVDLTWAPDGNMIYTAVTERGTCAVYQWPVVGGKPQQLLGGNREIAWGTFDRNCELLAFVAGDMRNVADLYVMDCREFEEKRLTNVNGELFDQLEWPKVEELTFKAPDGWDLHGWVMKPVGFEAGQKYPLVLEVHGGPATAWGHAFSQEFNLLAANGYGVLFINPRGSTSYGQKFVDAVRGDYGNKDFKDLMTAVDHVLAQGWVDEKRLAVTGGSYGGFMTNWTVTQTDRFAAAISHRSISNWVSFSGTPDFGPTFNKGSHKVEDPWSAEGIEALWSISPLKYVKNVKTPISLMQSEFDFRCPIEQAEQFFMAIKYYGQAPVELVRHPRSNHDLTRMGPPTVRVDRFHKILKWFGTYCPPNKAAEAPAVE